MRIITYNLRQLGKREQWLGLDGELPDLLLLQESNDPATYATTDRGSWLWTKASTTKFGSALCWMRSNRSAATVRIIGGDFNMATGRRDHGEELVTTRAERAVLDRIEREFGLTGCWQAANPGQPLPQTLRWVANPATAYHCDGIYIPQRWAASLRSCAVLVPPHPAVVSPAGRTMSDHNPVMADLALDDAPGLPSS